MEEREHYKRKNGGRSHFRLECGYSLSNIDETDTPPDKWNPGDRTTLKANYSQMKSYLTIRFYHIQAACIAQRPRNDVPNNGMGCRGRVTLTAVLRHACKETKARVEPHNVSRFSLSLSKKKKKKGQKRGHEPKYPWPLAQYPDIGSLIPTQLCAQLTQTPHLQWLKSSAAQVERLEFPGRLLNKGHAI